MHPKSLRVIITEECNLACTYCCNKIPKVRARFMKRALPNLVLYDNVCITGGEPMLYPKMLWYVASKAEESGCNTYLYTNGTLMNARRVEILKNMRLDGVNVSLHTNIQSLMHYELEKITCAFDDNDWLDALRFRIQDTKKHMVPEGYHRHVKWWHMDDCDTDEDIILLEEGIPT